MGSRTLLNKRLLLVLVVLSVLAGLTITLMSLTATRTTLTVKGRRLTLERVVDPTSQAKGLGGRDSLPQDHGMLFVFARDQARCFWMKGMRFPLDIIWLDIDKRVVQIAARVSPLTYPRSFCPAEPATYVVELNAGQAQELGIALDQRLPLEDHKWYDKR